MRVSIVGATRGMTATHAGRWIALAMALTAVLLRPTAAAGQAMTGAAPMRAETSAAKTSPAVPPEKSRPVTVTRFEKAPVIDEATRRAAQADRAGTLAQARDAVARDPSKRAAIIERLQQLGIAF